MLQGDEYIRVDDEEKPCIIGTGTEDYFNAGWFWREGVFHAPYHGLTIKDDQNSRFSAYRLHIPDPINFKKSISVEIEHGHANMLQEDYSSIAYWYQTEPHTTDFGKIPDTNEYLRPLGTKDEAYLMSEIIQDTEINKERRKTIHKAGKLRLELREAKKIGKIPTWFKEIDEIQFMKADYKGLKELIMKIEEKKKFT